jgi:putative DNA primase/helicase
MSVVLSNNAISQFLSAMAAFDLSPAEIIADGKVHRFQAPDDKHGKKSAWYILYEDGIAAGSFGNWKTGLSENWSCKSTRAMSPLERQSFNERIQKIKESTIAAKLALQIDSAKQSNQIWHSAPEAADDNPYCISKGITPYGLREFKNTRTLIVPIHDETGHITSLQFISNDSGDNKRFKSGGRIDGCFYSFGGKPQDTILICEGFATGASLHLATGYPVAIAFVAGNLPAVASHIRRKFIDVRLILCADNDRFKSSGNTGVSYAREAARMVAGLIAVPQFQSDDGMPTDFNDLHKREGVATVRASIENVIRKQYGAEPGNDADDDTNKSAWPEPEPLVRSGTAEPYPLDALPKVIRLAVEEVQGFAKAPIAMVACSALANLSLAAQAQHDVLRAEKLTGPIGLYFLVIAESGERKSTCDGMFSKVVRDYENLQQEEAKQALQRHEADQCAWDAIKSGIVDGIKKAASKASDTDHLEHDLRKHEEMKPVPPRVPRLIYADATPEALTYSLGKNWPSGGVISSEAGAVFGSHGMGKDSQLRTLAILNQLWDAAKLTFDRRGESYTVDGARLTMSLQVQESALMEFIKKTGTLARGTGFLARFLMAHPESTQGTRLFSEPPKNMPSLAAYHTRLAQILQAPAPINDKGGLEPAMLTLSPDAKAAWVRFHDEIENGLGKGGELQDVRDVASKIADNAARLAALFHSIEGGNGAISLAHLASASRIAAWHLNESLRFFGELALPEELADAVTLDNWLIDYCKTNRVDSVSTRTMSQYAPYKLRDKIKRESAIQELIERGRAALLKNGKRLEVMINPQLLRG